MVKRFPQPHYTQQGITSRPFTLPDEEDKNALRTMGTSTGVHEGSMGTQALTNLPSEFWAELWRNIIHKEAFSVIQRKQGRTHLNHYYIFSAQVPNSKIPTSLNSSFSKELNQSASLEMA